MKKSFIKITLSFGVCFLLAHRSNAQLSLTGQLRTRTELRDGYAAPLPKGAKPAFLHRSEQDYQLAILLIV